MRIVGVALSMAGGAQIRHVVATELAPDGITVKRSVALHIKSDVEEQVSGDEDAWGELARFLSTAHLVVFDAGEWNRLRRLARSRAKTSPKLKIPAKAMSVRAWAKEKFPRRRKDLLAIARYAAIEHSLGPTKTLQDDAWLLAKLGQVMTQPVADPPSMVQVPAPLQSAEAANSEEFSLPKKLIHLVKAVFGARRP